ncbi:MAG: septum formation initiator family protein [Desulfuromonadaceae bacterium]|nr:septum formation initiator family protein [Desulfuromonadaceae bacterium]MDD5104938.1 septum formation initiator family protein [Desulfuromonadaceae bacterium]
MFKFPLQKRMYFVPVGCLAFILFFTVFGDKGLLRIVELKQDKSQIEARLAENRADNEKLKREIVALRSDRRYLESIARKDFGLVRSNEVIYQFLPDKKQPETVQGY